MRIVFRTEGNHKQGMGDIWGAIGLADECTKYFDEILFVISGGDEAIATIKERGHQVIVIESLDAEQQILQAFQPDIIFVNKLRNSPTYIISLREFTDLVVTMDDAGEGALHADMKINVLYHIPGAVTDSQYIALRREFQEIHNREKNISDEVHEILVTQGGADTYGYLPKILRSLETLRWRPHFNIVVGPAFQHHDELEDVLKESTLNLSVIYYARNMEELMLNADLGITAGGLTMFEMACVGTPSIVICGEQFEVETAGRFDKAGVAVNLGFGGTIDYDTVPVVVDSLAMNVEKRRQMSIRGKELVDGQGCKRIISLVRDRVMAMRKGCR